MNPRGLACPARFERATYALEAQKIDNFSQYSEYVTTAKNTCLMGSFISGIVWNSMATGWHRHMILWFVLSVVSTKMRGCRENRQILIPTVI